MTAVMTMGLEDNNDWEYEPLTDREIEVMCLFANPYYEYAFISDKLNITVGTLKTHVNHIFDKLGETDRYTASIRFFKLYPQHRRILNELLKKP